METIPAEPEVFARWCEEHGIDTVVAGGSDTHGIWRGKRLPVPDFIAALPRGIAVSDVIFVLTHGEDAESGEELIEPAPGYAGYFPRKEDGFPDLFLRPDLITARPLPWHERTVGVVGTFALSSGDPAPIDPRAALQRVSERGRDMGYEARVGLEYEFYALRGDARSLRDAGWRLDPIRDRPYMYSVYGGSLDEDVLGALRRQLAGAGIEVEASFPETGAGQVEVNLRHGEVVRATDAAFVYKTAVKEILAQHGMLATFMAKPATAWAGSSCHVHASLWESGGGSPLFADTPADDGLSDLARHYVGGLLATMRELTALLWPTPNSYRRNAPYSWAGTTVSWGSDNRTTGLRAIVGSPEATRIEHRVPGADANPYIAVAATLAGGLHGIAEKIEPPPAFEGDAYSGSAGLVPLPATLDEALDALEASDLARELLGAGFIEHFLRVKRHEASVARAQVTDWEVRRYLELA